MDHSIIYLVLAGCFGLFMAWGIGANDVANAMATSVGSKALTLRNAVIIAAIFEFAGAFLAGGQVTATIRKGIIDASLLSNSPELLVYGMLAALLSAGIWLLVATQYGLPVSTTHSIVGAIVGFAAVGIGMEAVNWGKVGSIAASWVVSPVIAGALAYALFRSVQILILDTSNPMKNAKRFVPFYIFLTGAMISLVTMFKGLKHIGLDLTNLECYGISVIIGALCAIIGSYLIKRLSFKKREVHSYQFHDVELVFGVLMIFTACAMAFAHGSNDVANAVGPVAAIVSIVTNNGVIAQNSIMPIWILLLGAVGIVAGLMMYGHKVIATVGSGITDLTPSRGFCCNLAASTTVVIASGTGLPISTTHTLVGAVLGVGFARGISALNLRVIGSIFMSWVITLPAGAILAIIFFYILKTIFA
ncbi:MAG TPA: inorganic phosphate transporter [Thiotrichaceae bacterium]|nr:inorganic phosphate transporter [Thiotrichaceae bacterium]HIM07525.1 inorganic phosphate transporter [Gammaproteobacteria bacterium]